MWIWRRGRRRRRAEHKIAARLVTNAILEIRFYAQQGPEHLTRIRELADVVHNLPGGILGGGERGREPYGYHTFRWMWETASAEQRGWLVAQFEPLDYDYSYLERAPSPAPRKPVRRSASTKTVNAATLLTLDPAAAFEIRHADPGAFHILMPRGLDEVSFHPAEPGISEFNCLLRMIDGEIIVVHPRFETALFEALPARPRALRWTTPDRVRTLGPRTTDDQGWPAYHAGISAGLAGDVQTARTRLTQVATATATSPWQVELARRAQDLCGLVVDQPAFRDHIRAVVVEARALLKVDPSVPAHLPF